jgi:hypothetical protein
MPAPTDQNSTRTLKFAFNSVFWLGGFIFLSGLAALMVSGWFSRYLQDDYCFDFLLKHRGFWNAQVFTFFNEITFNGNRFSTNLVMGILAQIGPISARLLPGLLVVGWLAAVNWLIHNLDWLFKWHWPNAFKFFISTSIVLFSLILAPNLYQVLFWRPAAVTYLMPLILLTLLFAWIFHCVRNDQHTIGSIIISFLLAFWIGGYSETAAVFLAGLLLIIFFWIKFTKILESEFQKNFQSLFVPAIIGTFLSILVLIISPAARLRQVALFPKPPILLEIFRISLDGIRQFILLTLYRQTLPTLLYFLIFFYAGFLFSHFLPKSLAFRKSPLLKDLFLVFFSSFLLLSCVAIPSAYASSSIPEERALLWSRFTLIAALVIIAMLIGNWVGRFVANPARRRQMIAIGFFLAISCLIFILVIPGTMAFQPSYPEIRDWLTHNPIRVGLFILLFILTIWMSGRLKLEKSFIEELIPFLLLALIIAISLFGLPQLFKEVPAFQLRAGLWDWREAQIQNSILQGNDEIVLPALDSIAGVTELQDNPDHWVNNCAELYYGMKSIRAVPPLLKAVPASQ